MAKIIEITELLINEIESFHKSIDKLKEQTQIIKTHKISLKTDQLEKVLKSHTNHLIHIQDSFLKDLQENKPEINQNTPKYILSIMAFMLIISVGSLSYSIYTIKQADKKEKITYYKGINEVKDHFNHFLKSHPKAYKSYKKWIKK